MFGAGKSFLLAVVVQLLVKLLAMRDLHSDIAAEPSKLLISSTTNVAVDRILLGLLDAGFDQFVRVGSVKKIAKPVLPHRSVAKRVLPHRSVAKPVLPHRSVAKSVLPHRSVAKLVLPLRSVAKLVLPLRSVWFILFSMA